MKRVRLSTAARTYLRRETEYLLGHDRSAARRFSERMTAALRSVADFERLGGASSEMPVAGLRRLVVGDYLVFYETVRDEIHVLTIRHGRQGPPDTPEGDFDYESDPD